ncbi:MAG: mannose-1-phosphate guanylyltransferase [Gemmatimonadota bacterium]
MTSTGTPFVVVLAGGIGSRFWPASTPDRPKQLLPLAGPRPLIVDTVERAVALAGWERIRILTGARLAEAFSRTLPELGADHFLVEPRARGTGPALAWAASHFEAIEPGAVMVSLHADHMISPIEGFRETLDRAVTAAVGAGRLFCIGVPPVRPETGYGYVEVGAAIGPGTHEVARFVEKPDRARAEGFVASGRYLWNSGIFTWRAADLLDAIRRHTPEVSRALGLLEAGDVAGFFGAVQPISVDVGVMERAEAVGVVEATFRWDDIGTWTGLARITPLDAAGNAVLGEAGLVESADNIVWSEEGRVVLFGVRGLVVVRAGSETLVTTRESAPDLKRLLQALEAGEEDSR